MEQQDSPYVGYTWSESGRKRFSSPEPSVEHALVSIPVLLCPDTALASQVVYMVQGTLFSPEFVEREHHEYLGPYDHLGPYPERNWEYSRTAILVGLAGAMWGMNSFLALCDWRERAEDIQEKLRYVPSRPAMSWDETPGPIAGPAQHPDDSEAYLRETARQSREAGMALVRITVGDSYHLAFAPLNRTEILLADAAAAGFTAENDCLLEIVDP
ncbi:hypothetical protein AB0F85_17910 [Nocardia fluminea]|uniref:DUF6630 family protein n=1 Tax=Nocardia fluminea TaxID=134984 RepID=UPI0033D5A00D